MSTAYVAAPLCSTGNIIGACALAELPNSSLPAPALYSTPIHRKPVVGADSEERNHPGVVAKSEVLFRFPGGLFPISGQNQPKYIVQELLCGPRAGRRGH